MTEQWPALLCVLDFQSRFKQVNPAWARLGISPQVLLTTTFTHWLHPDDLVTTEESLSRLYVEEEVPIIFENRWRDAKGEYRWLLWSTMISRGEQLIYAVGIEVTEQKQLEQYHQAIVNGSPQGILLYDREGKIRVCNPGAEKILGQASAGLLGQADWNIATVLPNGSTFPPESHPAGVTLRTEKPCQEVVMGICRPDKIFAWLSVNTHPLRLQEAATTDAVVLSVWDISETKQREEEAQTKLNLLTAVFENTQIGIAIVDEDGRFVRVNPAYSKLSGYSSDELLGQSFTLLLPPPIRKEAALSHHNSFTYPAENNPWPMQHRNGQLLKLQQVDSQTIVSDHRPLKILCVIPSGKLALETGVAESLPQGVWLQTLFKQLPVTLLGIDRDGYLTFAQGPHLNQFGLTETQGRGVSVFADHHKLSEMSAELERALGGEILSKVMVVGGNSFEINFVPVLKEQECIGTLGLVKDMTELRMLKARLKQATQELEFLAPHTSLGMMYVETPKIVRVNAQCAALLGYNETELLKTSIISLFRSANDYQYLQTQATPYLAQSHSYRIPQRLRKKDGSFVYCRVTLKFVNHSRELWVLEEISELVNTTDGFSLQAALWTVSNEAILIVDGKLRIQQVNPATTVITGYTAEELVTKSLFNLDSGRQDQLFYQSLLDTLNRTGQWQGEMWQRHKNNAVYVCDTKIQSYEGVTGKTVTNHYVVMLSNKQASITTFLDPLTGLPGHLLFRHHLLKTHAVAQRNTKRFAILLIGIDNMTDINTKYGCVIGDQLLQTVGQHLKASVRDSDTVARYKGDVFAIHLEEISKAQDAGLVAQMILFKMTQPFTVKEYLVQTLASIGVVIYPEDGKDADTLLGLVQTVMQRAKQRGSGQCCFQNAELEDKYR